MTGRLPGGPTALVTKTQHPVAVLSRTCSAEPRRGDDLCLLHWQALSGSLQRVMMRVAATILTLLAAPVAADPIHTPLVSNAPVLEEIGQAPSVQAVKASLRPVARSLAIPVPEARWDETTGQKSWTLAVVKALRTHASALPALVPKDVAAYCPAYPHAPREMREAFWVGLISSLAWHESTHRPTAVGGGGLWYGLTQILPSTARGYGCKAKSGAALKNPEDNLSCALRIMAVTVPRDRVISAGMRGVAADWGPFHSARKREDIKRWTRSQPYCSGLFSSLRPVARPGDPAREQPNPVARINAPNGLMPVIVARDRFDARQPVIGSQSHAQF